ncbi:hypothetical protein PENTCL1PPCAC_19545, partial [Pristionchus entomophagus]
RLCKSRANSAGFGTARKGRFPETVCFVVLEGAEDDGHIHFTRRARWLQTTSRPFPCRRGEIVWGIERAEIGRGES